MTAKLLVGVALLAMSEDVEIMRQIVERAVGDTYKNRAAVRLLYNHGLPAGWTNQHFYTSTHGKASDATGVYLPGYGALIQLSAPLPFPELSQMKLEFDSVSQWEAARRELHGESSAERPRLSAVSDSTHTPTREQLTRRVLEVLAKNGHNFRELPASERLTVDVVFRDRKASRCAECHEAGAASLAGQPWPVKLSAVELRQKGYTAVGPLANDMAHAVQGLSVQLKSADENAGDLHMRQKNYAKAIEAFQKALKIGREKEADDIASQKRTMDQNRLSLYRKLAQACVGAGQYREAELLLKLLARYTAKPDDSPSGTKSPARTHSAKKKAEPVKQPNSPAAALPAHLIISATKSQLDAVAEGKMSRDEFAKAAQIEYLDPLEAATEEKSDNGKPRTRR